jgi:putative ABC transport system permease protein
MNYDLARFALQISVQQVLRRARRSAAAFVGIAGGLLLVLMQLGFQNALYDSAVRLHRALDGDLVIVAKEFRSIQNLSWFPRHDLIAAQGDPDVASIAPLYLSPVLVRDIDDGTVATLLAIGLDLNDPAIKPERLSDEVQLLRLPGRMLFDRKSLPFYGDVLRRLRNGGETDMLTAAVALPLQVQLIVIGSHALGGTIIYGGTGVMSAATLASITGQSLERVNIGVVKLRHGANAARAITQLKGLIPDNLAVMSRDDFVALEKKFWSDDTPIGFLFDMGAAVGFLISAVYIYQVLFHVVEENLSEYAVLKTMGYPSWFFTVLIAVTAAILALAALPLAVALSAALYRVCVAQTQLELQLTAARVGGVGGLALATAMVSAWLAKRRLSYVDPAVLM